MPKSENKTVENANNVNDFLNNISEEQKADCLQIDEELRKCTKEEPKMWGAQIVGYGRYHYKYESGREGDFMKIGFAPRKNNITLYIMPGFNRFSNLMEKLGKFKNWKIMSLY